MTNPMVSLKKCAECGSPTAAPVQFNGAYYCQEHGLDAQNAWHVWVVYDYDMGYHIRAIYPDEIDALRHAQRDGYFQYVKRVTAGDIADQLK